MKKNTTTIVLIVITAVAVLAAGGIFLMKSGGLGSGGAAKMDKAVLEGNIQVVNSELAPSGYPDLIVQAGVPVRWNLYAAPGTINSCNNAIVIPEYGLEIPLKEGDNIIEFTPDKSGAVPYSCWMGMINADILVVDDLASADNADGLQELRRTAGNGPGAGGCCGLPRN